MILSCIVSCGIMLKHMYGVVLCILHRFVTCYDIASYATLYISTFTRFMLFPSAHAPRTPATLRGSTRDAPARDSPAESRASSLDSSHAESARATDPGKTSKSKRSTSSSKASKAAKAEKAEKAEKTKQRAAERAEEAMQRAAKERFVL